MNSYSPQEIGIAERANGVVLPPIRAMLTATQMPNLLWDIEQATNQTFGFVSPYEKLYGVKPNLGNLRTWGCLARVRIPPESRQRKEKLQPRVRLSLLLGYSISTKGYKFLDLVTCQVITAQGGNFRFHEEFTANGDYAKQLLKNAYLDCTRQLPSTMPVERIKTTMDTYIAASAATNSDSIYLLPRDDPVGATSQKQCRRKKCDASDTTTSGSAIHSPPAEPCLKRPRRTQKPNVRLLDYVVGHVRAVTEDIAIPSTYKHARSSKHWLQWKAAMLSELQPLKRHQTWELVPRATAKQVKVITCRWAFAVKRDERGRVTRFKARLVVHGFKQQRGVDYSETFAPVIDLRRFGQPYTMQCSVYDVKTAFLYGDLTEVIFMEQPPGFQESGPEFVCRLMKSLYGPKQAPHIWNKTLHAKLVVMGFARMELDFDLYALKENDEVKMLLTGHVDDLILMGPGEVCEATAASLRESFELTTTEIVRYLHGVEIQIDQVRRQIIYSQQQYVMDVLKDYHMSTCNWCATPEATSPSKAVLPETTEKLPYRELVVSLQNLALRMRRAILLNIWRVLIIHTMHKLSVCRAICKQQRITV
ncbi:Integrase catalytic core protein [Phytophthora palmivora]|uniref:Integrase catalytic core protein n=1 Tax=Phytophthora palmivora TaxID=4796 RepID=A0A2P4XA28_9STRA|nr:Integrase catalytic core protein [Phytophthora palmivora]